MGKRLYEMTIRELRTEAERYGRAGNEMWANLCGEQISLNYRIAEAFQRSCASAQPQADVSAAAERK
jgi:hypothetical protein